MKQINFSFLVYILVNIAIAFCCYFYPVTRDEFYYLDFGNKINYFEEYWQSYFYGNPRIGQFLCNVISRHKFLEVLFGVLLFNSFIGTLFLNIYRRLPNIKSNEDVSKFLLIGAVFIFLISYFGEMFFYTPFSTNYTFTHIFYLIFVYILNEYFLYKNKRCLDNYPITVFLLFGLFIGMGNEHVPPVLLLMSFIMGLVYLLQNKEFPNFRFITLGVSIFIGYCFLFFAPANKIKEQGYAKGKTVLGITPSEFFENFLKILKLFFYYNKELIFFGVVFFVFLLIRKGKFKKEFISIFFFSILPLFIVAVSPIIGTRLLFFSATMFIIIVLNLFLTSSKEMKAVTSISYMFLFLYFTFCVKYVYKAHQNQIEVFTKIQQQSKISKEVKINGSFQYFDNNTKFARKLFLDRGEDYIDGDAANNNTPEYLLIKYFRIKSLKNTNSK